MTELIKRLDNYGNKNTAKMMSDMYDLFNDQSLLGNLFYNTEVHRFISAQNYTYDMLCKYFPKLQDALEIMRDNVLSADSFSKKFLNPKSVKTSADEARRFAANADKIEKRYDMSEFLDNVYMHTSKYGESFVYVVPYDVAFKRMVERGRKRSSSAIVGYTNSLFEGYSTEKLLAENYQNTTEFKTYTISAKDAIIDHEEADMLGKDLDKLKLGEVNLHFNESGIVKSFVNEHIIVSEKEYKQFKSLTEQFFDGKGDNITEANNKEELNSIFSNVKKANKQYSQGTMNADGLILPNSLNKIDPEKIDKDFNGAVLERLPRENVVPVYLSDKVCVGYYYFEFADDPNACGFCGGHHMTPGISNANRAMYDASEDQQELAIRYIASRISTKIDTKFINANKDLKEEIYAILRYNEKFDISRSNNIGVTFIPADDIVHCYLNMDHHNHRGISDLAKSVVPGMLWILLSLSNIIAQVTLSTDKRVYYVKQNVEQNVARTMMNVVAQIKKGNMGMRQIESINNMLNVVGKYNNYVIPLGPSGDPPIQFDVMQGQDIQTPTDMLEKLEEQAVNPIMPLELINATMQQDFAVKYTMTNARFLRRIYQRQRRTETFFSKIYTPVYNYEFDTSYFWIQIILPPPIYSNMMNNAQLIDNIVQMADKINEIEHPNEEEDFKAKFKELYLRENLGAYLDYDQIKRLADAARVAIESEKEPQTEEGEDDVMNDEF